MAHFYRPEFVAFVEPLPQITAVLETEVCAPHQKVFACALGHECGKGNLNVLASSPSSSLLDPNANLSALYHRDMSTIATIEVPIHTLDDVFSECRIDLLDLLKVDVEGYDLEVFAGGKETLRKTKVVDVEVVFFEDHKGRPLFKDIYNCLAEAGFELRGLTGYSYDPNGIPLHCDGVFIYRMLYTSS